MLDEIKNNTNSDISAKDQESRNNYLDNSDQNKNTISPQDVSAECDDSTVNEISDDNYDIGKNILKNITHGNKKYNIKTILKMRATELSKGLVTDNGNIDFISIVKFVMANENYGIETSCIREVCHLRNFKKIPCVPPHIFGVINFYGQIMPVVDLKVLLKLPVSEITTNSRVIILHSNEIEFGIIADSLIGNNSISISSIQTKLSTLSEKQKNYFKGITTDNTVILDALKILTDTKLIVNEQI